MSVRFIHTADWHLGQLFHQHNRYKEHDCFLNQLLAYIEQYQPDAVLIAGDIFDVINPPSQAQKQLYQFLSDVQLHCSHTQVLMIAGNHDSGYRIEQVNPLLEKYQTKAVGVMNWQTLNEQETLDFEHLIIPIYDQNKTVVAWCVALPFLRSAEITGHALTSSDPKQASEKIYRLLLDEVHRRCEPQQAIIMMTHAHLQGGDESKESERPIIIGHEEALSAKNFINLADYVALGHLHKAQKVQHEYIRYSGSPIPLSFSESRYAHQVMLVEIDKQQANPLQLTPLKIPHLVQLKRISCHLNDLFEQIQQLEQGEIEDIELRHFLDIEYESQDVAPPDLRLKIEQALPANRYRLVRLARKAIRVQQEQQGDGQVNRLEPPTPMQLFEMIWQKSYNDVSQLDEQVRQDFQYLEQIVHQKNQ